MMAFYDVGHSDIKELWDYPYFSDSILSHDSIMNKDEEWGNGCMKSNVILRDRLMTDAALGGPRPIKSEHSYSLLTSSPPPSPATPGDNPYTPNSGSGAVSSSTTITSSSIDFANLDHKPLDIRDRIDDMEEECFPAISINSTSSRVESASSSSSPLTSSTTSSLILKRINLVPEDNEYAEIKDEPISAPTSPCAPCQANCDMVDDTSTITMVSPQNLHFPKTQHMSDSEEDDEEYYQNMEIEEYGVVCERKEATLHASRQGLPPTPPSSISSDSEGTASASCSPERRDSQTCTQNLRGLLAPRLYVTNSTHTRQPIHTPLISCQPKGSTVLTLTEEEKRTLIAEGFSVPTKLPLTKLEEKSLKKIRRKIKNKISAQESRRKKKEYMDGLEKQVTTLTNENSSYRERLNFLEVKNRELMKEIQRLQSLLQQS